MSPDFWYGVLAMYLACGLVTIAVYVVNAHDFAWGKCLFMLTTGPLTGWLMFWDRILETAKERAFQKHLKTHLADALKQLEHDAIAKGLHHRHSWN